MRAIWQSIYRDLRFAILDGTYPFQAYLPSESALVARYACSHNTVRRAIAALAEEGLVQPVHGKGVRVLYRPRPRALFEVGGIETYEESARRLGLDAHTRVLACEACSADETLAQRSGFPVGYALTFVERLRVIDGKPAIRDVNYFSRAIAGELSPAIVGGSIYRYLEQERGVHVALSQRQITVEPAAPRDQELLALEEGSCVAVVTSQTFTREGELFEYTQSRHRPEQFAFHDTARRLTPAL